MKLWEHKIPFGLADDFVPELVPYVAENSKSAVIVCPGGAYEFKAPHEGKAIAEWFNSIGITAFVLDYRVSPNRHPAELADAMRAIKYVRYNAEKYGIDRNRIAVMGFSAGGHLAASLSVHYDKDIYEPTDIIDEEDCKPNATILCYPVIDMGEYRHDGSRTNLIGSNPSQEMKDFMSLHKQVTKDTPPAFLWHTSSDAAVPVENSLMYAAALSKVQVPFEMHIYPIGPHGLGLSPDISHVAHWNRSCYRWLRLLGFTNL